MHDGCCLRCGHEDADHASELGLCDVPRCPCVGFVEDEEEPVTELDELEELNFDRDGDW